MGALTKATIRTKTEPGRYADGHGLYLHVRKGGSRQWLLRITVRGRRRDIGLGPVDFVTLEEARAAAIDMKRIALAGGDPVEERRRVRRVVPTFEEAARSVHAEHIVPTSKNGKHIWQWLRTLELYAFPVIGQRAVNDVDQVAILRVLQPIWIDMPETSMRVKQRMHAIMDWARASGHVEGVNPVDGIERGLARRRKAAPKHHRALPYAELPALWPRLVAAEGMGALALRFTILTAGRSGEVRGARWSEIDGSAWSIPAERMKASRAHAVPLSSAALDILGQVRGFDRDLVFPSTRAGRPLSDMTLAAVLKRLEVGVTVHGFRSSFRDWCEETGVRRSVAEAALAHAVADRTEAAYRRTTLFDERRPVMDAWATFVTGG